MKIRPSERGQSLVLIILAIVAMFGFAALAVDVGRVYAERRRAQSAADASAYAAAMAAFKEADWSAAALNQAQLNDYVDPDAGVNPGQRLDIQVFNPPAYGVYADPNREDYKDYFQVVIRDTVDTVFAQIVGRPTWEFTVEAVVRAKPEQALFDGDAMVATNPSSCKAIWFQGNAGTFINGGNIFSNSDRSGTPATCYSGVQNGNGRVSVTNGAINTVGGFIFNTGDVTADAGINRVPQQDMVSLQTPYCGDLEQRTYNKLADNSTGKNVLQPGYYKGGIKVNGGERVRLQSGLYCLEDDFTMLGGDIMDVPDPVTGKYGVMFVMLKGNFNIAGNVSVYLNRMSDFTDGLGQSWHGMLLFMPYRDPWFNDGIVHLGGTGNSMYTGTIYAPGPAHSGYKCTIEGDSGSIGLYSNVICNTIYVTGNAAVKITYKPEQNFRTAQMVSGTQ